MAPLGWDRLDQIEEIRFTFRVERDGQEKGARSWTWHPADNRVTRGSGADALTFTFGAPATDAEKEADAQFVNDSFWLAPQLHLGWAKDDLTVTDGGMVDRPIGEGEQVHLVTMQYAPSGGGYTPGDAYDLYLDGEGRIVVWNYREGGAAEPTMTTTFEGYVPVGPLQIAAEHYSADRKFRLSFTDLSATPATPR
ncbi:MAG: hypothetical protein R3F59_05440 [Myxococcota bacterium]